MIYDDLLDEADKEKIDVFERDFSTHRIRGLYCDGTIAIKKELETSVEKSCVLAEELGHHYTSHGNILNQTITSNRKQERQARLWAYNRLIGLGGIIRAYKARCSSLHEVAEYLDVTEEFLAECLECYRQKYGCSVSCGNHTIVFEPSLAVFEQM